MTPGLLAILHIRLIYAALEVSRPGLEPGTYSELQ
jgi:hypothetical protein